MRRIPWLQQPSIQIVRGSPELVACDYRPRAGALSPSCLLYASLLDDFESRSGPFPLAKPVNLPGSSG